MGKYYKENEFNELVDSLVDAVENFNLVVFVGAGISLSQGYPNWNGYIDKLIHFWQFNIRNFSETDGKIDNRLLSIFDEILYSNNTNKRKIDLLHTLLYDVLGEKFSNAKLDFEKYFFNNVAPDYIENSVLSDLIKLNPIFITSNYDFEIERHLKRSKQKGTFIPINNIREFTELNNVLRSNDVLHLHGTTAGDSDYFVNSSYDYSRQYLKKSEEFNNLREWFQKKNPVVLFLGSSMEEEEILSLLPATTKNFAMMKANSNESEVFRNIYNKTYQNNNNTTVFWYGDSYDDLPNKVNEVVNAVQNKLEIPESIDDWNTLHTIATDDGLYKEILEKYIEDDRFLFDIFKTDDSELEKKILKNMFSSELLFKKGINISNFWIILHNNFENLDESQVDLIIQGYKSMNLNIHWVETFHIFEKLRNLSGITQEDLNEIRKNFSHNNELVRTSFSSDANLMGYWIVEQLKSGHSYYRDVFYDSKIFRINLKSEMIPQIIESLNNESRYRYLAFHEVISEDLLKLIYESLSNGETFLDDKPILENFPEELLETRLYQRILVNIDNEVGLNDILLSTLIKKIDFSDTIFGNELTNFIDKNRQMIEKLDIEVSENYHDGIGKSEFGIVHPKSFINNHQILNEDIETVVDILLKSQDESFSTREDFFSERTYQATSDFLRNSLNKNDEISEKVKRIILEKGSSLYPKYEKLFVDLLIGDNYDPELKTETWNILLEKFQFDSFSWENKRLFEAMIDEENYNNSAFSKLLQVEVNKLNHDYAYIDKDRPELLEVDDFVNTELGRYLGILLQLNKKVPSKYNEIKSVVSSVKSNEFREFTQGALTTVKSFIDTDTITINIFQGYCYSIYGFKKEELEKFTLVGKELLRKGYVNEFNKKNLFILSLSMINPSDDTIGINWTEINFSQLIDVILQNKIEYPYESQWVKEIILNDEDGQYGRSIIYSLMNKYALIDKSEKIIEVFERYIYRYTQKINIELLPESIKEQEDLKKKDLFIRLFFVLLDNAKIAKSYFGSRSVSDFMKDRKSVV